MKNLADLAVSVDSILKVKNADPALRSKKGLRLNSFTLGPFNTSSDYL